MSHPGSFSVIEVKQVSQEWDSPDHAVARFYRRRQVEQEDEDDDELESEG